MGFFNYHQVYEKYMKLYEVRGQRERIVAAIAW